MSSAYWDMWTLPGVRGHLDAVSADLDAGLSCLWVVPDDLVRSGTADELLDRLAARSDSMRVPAPVATRAPGGPARTRVEPVSGSTAPPDWAKGSFSLLKIDGASPARYDEPVADADPVIERVLALCGATAEPGVDPLLSAVRSPELRGAVVVLSAWHEHDRPGTSTLLSRLPALVKEQGQAPGDRPRLLVAARPEDLVASTLDPVTTRTHWWWGVKDRLDTAVVVARVRRGRGNDAGWLRERVTREVIAEVAGPDLVLADWLARSWDGAMARLPQQVAGLAYTASDVPSSAEHGHGRDRPPLPMRAAWSSGLLDLWEGQARTSPAADRGVDLGALVWRGQNRALMPVVDEHRALLERVVLARASKSVLAELDSGATPRTNGRSPANALELGQMWWLVSSRRVTVSHAQRKLLLCLRRTRNALAHLQALDDDELAELTCLIAS
ncbi:hypothetical protein [Actinokineospora cianjurensis]|uniref:Uncharacterized protein n=1 Tax=Actinokineospora cianjurensis TaxID=585224 RepID=A0A421AWN3_9PSEU|nr:hypothetical protein [Actinokineospora cianjurensis]RLK54182.1 hypothetical protein CLV68_6185 [Actinokineospora cianjurensis]